MPPRLVLIPDAQYPIRYLSGFHQRSYLRSRGLAKRGGSRSRIGPRTPYVTSRTEQVSRMTHLPPHTESAEAKRLKALEEENAELKKSLAEKLVEAAALRERLSSK